MQEIAMLDAIERYMRGEMLPEERVFFEQLRKSNAGVDQMVVEHTILLDQMHKFGERRDLRAALSDIHNNLFESGTIQVPAPSRVVTLWKRYKRVIAVAASIAGITALAISGLISYISPKVSNEQIIYLSRQIQKQDKTIKDLSTKLNTNLNDISRIPLDAHIKAGGTGFLVDGRGYLVTNAHVVNHANGVVVQNYKGQEFKARIIHTDSNADLTLLKIEDEDFKAYGPLPYGISRNSAELGEQIFTLGYPRDEIVYGEGYMSAKTGFEGDTLACQIAVAANPGNSGGPVLNKNGEIIGILSTREIQAQGVVFAIKSKNIFKAVEEMKTDSSFSGIKLPTVSSLKGMERVQQIRKMEDCIFIVKSY